MRNAFATWTSIAALSLVPRCDRAAWGPARSTPTAIDAAPADASPPSASPEVPRVVEAPVPGDLSAFVIRGARRHALSAVFLAGICSHPGGYLAAFPWTAVEHGDVIALQGDVPCGDGTYRRWGADLDRIDHRIEAAFRAAGLEVPEEIVLIGYSQGAERAERLAAHRPDRYKKLVLISSPVTSSPKRLAHASAVLLGIGEYEAQASTIAGVDALDRAGVTTGWFVLPKAPHGLMGPDAQTVLGDALTWLEDPRAPPEKAAPNGKNAIRPPVGRGSRSHLPSLRDR
jgi:pimeloyl-ACP methyl ester carboxylesterase